MSVDTLVSLEIGKLSKSHPFQSELFRFSLSTSSVDESVVENALLRICSNSNKAALDNGFTHQLSIDKHKPLTSQSYCCKRTTSDLLEFADDLIMTTECTIKKCTFEFEKTVTVQQQPTQIHEIPNDHKRQCNNDSYSNKLFKTAKDQYNEEGGKFEKNTSEINNSLSASRNNMVEKTLKRAKGDSSALPEGLQHLDKALVERIEADILHSGQPVRFDDISGLEFAKKCVTELICWPMSRPDLFQGLRALPRGLLLFGPPGTGKTLIGKAIAHQSGATFFSISASSLMSKWIGEGEQLVRTLFDVAAFRQPAVVFLDEVDSLLCQRSSEENEASRRMKTEFMVQLDGASTSQSARVVIVGATNRPEELDEAVRRRFVKRIYIPLPDAESRRQLLQSLLKNSRHCVSEGDLGLLVDKTDGFSGADIRSLCTEAAMGPMREVAALRRGNLDQISPADVPNIAAHHFSEALEAVMPTVSPGDLQRYVTWNESYGSFRRMC